MHHPEKYTDRIETTSQGRIIHTVTAWYKGNCLDVYMEDEKGEAWLRNLYSSYYSGRLVAFPGEPYSQSSSWWGTEIAELEEWKKCDRSSFFIRSSHLTEAEKEAVTACYPDFKYVLKKWNGTRSEVMTALYFWMEHREVELLLAAGFEKIAFSPAFYRLSESRKKKFILWMRNNPKLTGVTFNGLQLIIAHNLTWKQLTEYDSFCSKCYRSRIAWNDYCYLSKLSGSPEWNYRHYRDYVEMLKASPHSMKDSYWRYPKDIKEAHDRLVEEDRARHEAEQEEQRVKVKEQLAAITKKMKRYGGNYSGYDIMVSDDLKDWREQADALHQCIISAKYYDKVARNECVIVFIRKDGAPVATAEILPKHKLGQFYANEYDRNDCYPTEEVKAAFNQYFARVPKKLLA